MSASRIVRAIAAPNIIRSTGGARLEAIANSQNQYFQPLFRGQTNEPHSLFAVFTNSGVYGNNAAAELYIDYSSMKFMITNQSTAQVKVQILDQVSRLDLPYGDPDNNAYTLYANGLIMNGISNPLTLGVGPRDSTSFMDRWRTKATKTITMNPGQVYRHNVFVRQNWKVNRSRFDKINYDVDTLARRTTQVMFILSGFPCNDLTDKTKVGTAPCAIDITFESAVGYRLVVDNTTNTTYYVNTINPLATMTTPTVMDDDSGQGTQAIVV